MRCVALVATAAALSAPNIRVAEVPKLADRIEVTTVASPIGHTEAIHFVPSGDIFVDDDALIASQVTATRSRMIAEDATFFHRAGPRREVVFEKGEARACIVTCGGVCPGLNTVVRELYLCLAKQYGVQTVYGVQNGYSGFKNWSRDAVKMDSRFVYEIQRKGGTVLRSSRGGHDTSKICDALIENGVNMLFVIGGDGTMKGACKIDAEMSRRGKKCVVCCVPKTIDNDALLCVETSRALQFRVCCGLSEVLLSMLGRVHLSEVVAEFGPLRGPRRRDSETRITLRVNVVAATASGRRGIASTPSTRLVDVHTGPPHRQLVRLHFSGRSGHPHDRSREHRGRGLPQRYRDCQIDGAALRLHCFTCYA